MRYIVAVIMHLLEHSSQGSLVQNAKHALSNLGSWDLTILEHALLAASD